MEVVFWGIGRDFKIVQSDVTEEASSFGVIRTLRAEGKSFIIILNMLVICG